jgi:hypothetical protein
MVDVTFYEDGVVKNVTAVPESQIAKEQAEQALAAVKSKGGALASSAVARFGMATIIAAGLLLIGWFFLTTISYNAGFLGRLNFTFWRILAFINSSNAMESLGTLKDGGSAGFYGFLAIICLAGPFLASFWKDRRALLGGILPLAFMLFVAVLVRNSLVGMAGNVPAEIMNEARTEILKGISVGLGAYVSILAALYLAYSGIKKFLVARANS